MLLRVADESPKSDIREWLQEIADSLHLIIREGIHWVEQHGPNSGLGQRTEVLLA